VLWIILKIAHYNKIKKKNLLQETQDMMKKKKLLCKYSLNHLHCYKQPIAKLKIIECAISYTFTNDDHNSSVWKKHYDSCLIRRQLHGIVRMHNTKIKFNQEEGLK